jgi:S-DNA-T family DNA segregation ATPase FtsK/SpoIIIE
LVLLLGLGVALAALMLSYTPDDPNWMAATDTAPQNLLGRTGASVAAILMMIVGYGALVLPIASIVWGVSVPPARGDDRALPRVFFLPIVLALASIYSASHVPPSEWTHSFGLGGLFGDTVLGAVLNALPVSAQPGLKLIAAAAFLGGAAMLMHVAGISSGEFRATLRFLVYGLLSTIAMVVAGLARGRHPASGRPRVGPMPLGSRDGRRAEARAMDVATRTTRRRRRLPRRRTKTTRTCAAASGFLSRMPRCGRREPMDDL